MHMAYGQACSSAFVFECKSAFEGSNSVLQVIEECTPDGHISPATCIYMNDWLDF